LDASSDSEVHDSEFDDSDNEQVAAESSSDADSDSDATVDYEYDQAAWVSVKFLNDTSAQEGYLVPFKVYMMDRIWK